MDGGFLTAASPGVVALFQVRRRVSQSNLLYAQINKHFESHEKYIEALVPELAKE